MYATSTGGLGVNAIAMAGTAVNATGSTGVYSHGTTYGVYGFSESGTAVRARSTVGTAVHAAGDVGMQAVGESLGLTAECPAGTAVQASSTTGTGIRARGIVGVLGESSTGTGVRAVSASGPALKVEGRATFTQAGRIYISSGKSYVTVSGPKVGTGSAILATLNGNAGSGVYVKCAVRVSATAFKVYLSKAATRNVAISYFVIN